MTYDVKISCDGTELPIVPFVAEIVGNTVAALIGSLKGVESAKDIKVQLTKRS